MTQLDGSSLVRVEPAGQYTIPTRTRGILARGTAPVEEEHDLPGRGNSIARVVSACVMLTLLAALVACDFGPTPPGPGPLPSPIATVIFPRRTPTPQIELEFLRPNPLVPLRAADLDAALRRVVDRTYCTPAWRSDDFPASLSLPVRPVEGDLLFVWNSSGTSDYIAQPRAPTYGLPAGYTISTSADSTDGTDGTWREVVRVTDNRARTRSHRFPAAGARWVRMTVTSAVPGPLGDEFVIDEIDLHDASNSADDTVFFLGDSITVAAFARCPANQPSFAELVSRADPDRFPAMIDGGVGGMNSGFGVSVVEDWLDLNPDFNVWAIGYGTNDAWQKVRPSVFEDNLQSLIDSISEAGRIPVVARIPFASDGPDDRNIRALNGVIDRVASRNALLPGPDLYAWFRTHPDELGPDGVHPTEEGTRSINRLWYEALRPLYGISR
ncbi:MAG TPA: GDSL-type esterase/lipase family protein [Chloroflexia bacterium]|nr:GDSL-type esterase/lipase family protein [Chloroflexia bacterium]